MPLSDEEKRKIDERIRGKLQKCPFCGVSLTMDSPAEAVHDGIVAPPDASTQAGKLVVSLGRFFPLIAVWCKECGHTMFFHAKTVGLVE